MAREKDKLTDHEYDGIRELDNDLPPWWVYLFYFSIVFAVVYMLHYHVFGTGDLMVAEYNKEFNPNWEAPEGPNAGLFAMYQSPYKNPKDEVTPYVKNQFASYVGPEVSSDGLIIEAMTRADEGTLEKLKTSFPDLYKQLLEGGVALTPKSSGPKEAVEQIEALTDGASIAAGKDIFVKNCVSCHGTAGEGGIGPNLTDDFWIHGNTVSDVAHTIKVGVPAKGMITWRGVLSPEQIQQAASYIMTLHGTSPANAKAPQGEKYEYALGTEN